MATIEGQIPPTPLESTATKADTTAHDDMVRASLAKWALLKSAVVILLMVGTTMLALMYGEYTGKKFDPALYTLLGTIDGAILTNEYTIVKDAWTYYFGGSSGSTAKSVAAEKEKSK